MSGVCGAERVEKNHVFSHHFAIKNRQAIHRPWGIVHLFFHVVDTSGEVMFSGSCELFRFKTSGHARHARSTYACSLTLLQLETRFWDKLLPGRI